MRQWILWSSWLSSVQCTWASGWCKSLLVVSRWALQSVYNSSVTERDRWWPPTQTAQGLNHVLTPEKKVLSAIISVNKTVSKLFLDVMLREIEYKAEAPSFNFIVINCVANPHGHDNKPDDVKALIPHGITGSSYQSLLWVGSSKIATVLSV